MVVREAKNATDQLLIYSALFPFRFYELDAARTSAADQCDEWI